MKNALLGLSLLFNVASLAGFAFLVLVPAARSWTQRSTAGDGAAVAEVQCSGHGRHFIDTDEQGSCECSSCFSGKDCSQKLLNCTVDANGGDPLFLEPFWEVNAEAGTLVVPPNYRMSYFMDGASLVLKGLERKIREVHALTGNAITEGRYIVIGVGSIHVLSAAISSLAAHRTASPALLVSQAPYYFSYKEQTEFFDSNRYIWAGEDPAQVAEKFPDETVIEVVASPNNPDATMKKPVLDSSRAHIIYDRAYYWPHYCSITEALEDDIMIFTMSKLTGHAGSRLGWAIVKDRDVYQRMQQYVFQSTFGVPKDSQLRAWQLLNAVIEGYSKKSPAATLSAAPQTFARDQHIFHFAHAVMLSRWNRFEKAFEGSEARFSLLQAGGAEHCLFFSTVRRPSPAYAFVKCNEDENCYQVFEEAGIIGRSGFGVNQSYVRFTLIRGNDDFENLMESVVRFLKRRPLLVGCS